VPDSGCAELRGVFLLLRLVVVLAEGVASRQWRRGPRRDGSPGVGSVERL
jgi:hypothetical protein